MSFEFKTLSGNDATRIAAIPLDYEWNTTIGNGFMAAFGDASPRLADALEAINIHGAADMAVAAAEWGLARVRGHTDPQDAQRRLAAAWAATVDLRYAVLGDAEDLAGASDPAWAGPEWQLRDGLASLCRDLEDHGSAHVRQQALSAILLAEHLCGRDPAFGEWLHRMLRIKTASSPRRPDDHDHTFRDDTPPALEELTFPSLEQRLAGLDPKTNPYLRSAAEMAARGFVGDPYPGTR